MQYMFKFYLQIFTLDEGHVARMGEKRGVYMVWVGKPEGKRPLGRPRRRWKDNTKMDIQEVGCGGKAWTELAQDKEWWWVLELSGSIKCAEFLD
jgi:hypothetical protein